MADERKRSRWPWVVLAMPVLYVLSTGPVWALYVRGYLDDETYAMILNTAYYPLVWISGRSELVVQWFAWYIEFWEP